MTRLTETVFFLFLTLFLLFIPAGCGYHNPNVIGGFGDMPISRIYIPMWENQSAELNLEVQARNSVTDWLLQSGRAEIATSRQAADYLLEGEIVSLSYPGFSYDSSTIARALNAVLVVSVSLSDREKGEIIWQNNSLSLSETYNIDQDFSRSDANKREALHTLIDRLGEQVYMRVFQSLRNRQMAKD